MFSLLCAMCAYFLVRYAKGGRKTLHLLVNPPVLAAKRSISSTSSKWFWSILIIGYQCDKTRPSNFSFKGHVCLCLPSCLLGVFLSWLTSLFGIIQCDLLARLIWDSVSVFMISSLHERRCCCDRMAHGRFVQTTFGMREHVCHSFGFSSSVIKMGVWGVFFSPILIWVSWRDSAWYSPNILVMKEKPTDEYKRMLLMSVWFFVI